ncbi:hypothetical protein ACHWQZ_G005679 [Mnemiopsis leidyi]
MTKNILSELKAVCDSLYRALENNQPYDDTLCGVVEDLLLDGMVCEREKLWRLLKTVSHHSQNEFLENMENLSSHAGFVRAWVRVTLNDGAICSALKLLSEDYISDDAVKQYYRDDAFIASKENLTAASNLFKSLDKHELNFVCNTVVLNHWRNEEPQNNSCFLDSEEVTAETDCQPGFNRKYSVGNKLSVSLEEDLDSSHSSRTSSSTDVPQEKRSSISSCPGRVSLSESIFSENPAVRWQNSQSDLRQSSFSDLSYLPEEEEANTLSCNTEERLQYLTKITNEQGLSSQLFKCYSCTSNIGNQGQEFKVCNYDKKYYCRACYGNFAYFIPCKLIYNWDHNRYRVSKKSFDFLSQVHTLPNLDLSKLNISLYNHAPELAKVRDYRRMLNMVREYLVRCNSKDEVSYEVIRKKLGTHQYYWDTPHLYSAADLTKSFSGQLQSYLKKLAQKCIHHVYCCKKCSSLGFICEYCQNPKIIFAFELQTTDQCPGCGAVYHKSCKRSGPCPKCIRKEHILNKTRRIATT